MRFRHRVVTFHAAEMDAEAAFWAGVVDGVIDVDEGWRVVVVDGEPRADVQDAPDPVPPECPPGASKPQILVDLWVDGSVEAHERVISLGARLLEEVEPSDEPDACQPSAHPAGHPFCFSWLKRR